MNEREKALFESTKEYVRRACPKLNPEQRIPIVAAIYDKMHFVTKMPDRPVKVR